MACSPVIYLILSGLLGSTPSMASTHPIQAKLQTRVSTYSLRSGDFAHALISFADHFELPIGIEWVQSPETLSDVNQSWRDLTVSQMLKSMVKSQPGYIIEISGEIIHVFPEATHSSSQNFLNLKISNFKVKSQVVEVASHRLRDLVRSQVSQSEPKSQASRGIGYSQATNLDDPRFSASIEDATVRQVLDKLITASDRKIWIVTLVPDGRSTSLPYLRTTTLWTNAMVPDSEQPVWDLLRWSDSIP
jgi:hypothetical protein